MNAKLIFYPLLLQLSLTLAVYVYLSIVKARALKLDQVDLARRALNHDAWPDYVLQVSNNLRNQFEAPVLYYVLTLMLWALDGVNQLSLGLAWTFALSRWAHAAVHLRSNHVPTRRRIFSAGVVALMLMLLQCAWLLLS